MKKLIIVIVLFVSVLISFSACMTAAHAGHGYGTSQYSGGGGCH